MKLDFSRRGFLSLLPTAPFAGKRIVEDMTSQHISSAAAGLFNPLADAATEVLSEKDPVGEKVDHSSLSYAKQRLREFGNLFRGNKLPNWKIAEVFMQARHHARDHMPIEIGALRSVSAIAKRNMAVRYYFSRYLYNEQIELLTTVEREKYEERNKMQFLLGRKKTTSARKID